MPGPGTLINMGAIFAGGMAGLLFGKVITNRFQWKKRTN